MESVPRRQPSVLWPSRSTARIETGRGGIEIWTISPHVCLSRVHGHMTQEMSQLLIDQATQLYRAGAGRIVYGIHDWVAMTNYDSACRVDMTNWILRNRAQSVLHVATTSRMVAMGVMVAKVALGDVLNVHGTTEALEGVLADVLKKPR